MLRTFVQILRSGVTGRKSLGSAPKRLILQWLERADVRKLIQASVGNAPSLADIVKMVHPRPADPAREAFYAWLIGKPWNPEALPQSLQAYETWGWGILPQAVQGASCSVNNSRLSRSFHHRECPGRLHLSPGRIRLLRQQGSSAVERMFHQSPVANLMFLTNTMTPTTHKIDDVYGGCEALGIPPEWADRCEDSTHRGHDGTYDALRSRLDIILAGSRIRNFDDKAGQLGSYGGGNKAWVHRKGATRAIPGGHFSLAGTRFAETGHPILLPGNPRDGSVVMVAQIT